jgi:hypothetical protein
MLQIDSTAVRTRLVEALRLDLVGPDNAHAFAKELLPDVPQRWYLTGYLVPATAPEEVKSDPTAQDELELGSDGGSTGDDAATPEKTAAGKRFLASSLGLSVLVAPEVENLSVAVQWGDYVWEGPEKEPISAVAEGEDDAAKWTLEEPPPGQVASTPAPKKGFRREPREEMVAVRLPAAGNKPAEFPVPNSGGLVLSATVRATGSATSRIPKGTKSVSVFLVNKRPPSEERIYRTFAFQARLIVQSPTPFVPRPDLRGTIYGGAAQEWDEKVADLHYRDVFEYAVGHGVAAEVVPESDGTAVRTVWIPSAEVERVAPVKISGVELGMEALGGLKDYATAEAALMPLVSQYRDWINGRRGEIGVISAEQKATATSLLDQAAYAAQRIEEGIKILSDPQVLDAFCTANRAMAAAGRQREAQQRNCAPSAAPTPEWRPFQLAFILQMLPGMVDPTRGDRSTVDLLFFPTGGGKTEAYLGLAAFTLVLRRLRHPGIRSAGVSVLMRYTLRLLTLDQLGRAAALMCALEIEREKDTAKLGQWPFEIGLWVGSAATPNRMGHQGYQGIGKDDTAYIKTTRFQRESNRYPSPIPVENCPWCGTKFGPASFRLKPTVQKPVNLQVVCVNDKCHFHGDRPLPIVGVDEPIYRRLPSFIIATIDKFAALPWTGQVGALFGHVERYDKDGFYGPCDGVRAGQQQLGGPLPPPDLIIQDELHLISGPLGTIAGIYETAIETLASRINGDFVLRPKIIASTATVRRADRQIRALFGRIEVQVFPPSLPDRRHSFFAETLTSSQSPARLYVGVAAQGRSLKVVLLRSSLALLSACQTHYEEAGGAKNPKNAADPYMTLLGYFNSLRELGGSRRIIEDEVTSRLERYARRRRRDPEDRLFRDRRIKYDPTELTSRVSTDKVADAKRRLALSFPEKDAVDVALATNMISVGLDIVRLGLMVVLGQPKTSAEYIQATSRVGRDPDRPGLVVTLLNVHKPRDRSHYERFGMYHATFYRAVEATSVTPFSPRALDRALAAAVVGLCRHGRREMTPPLGAGQILQLRAALEDVAQRFAERAEMHDGSLSQQAAQELRDRVLNRVRQLLDDWLLIAQQVSPNAQLEYQVEEQASNKRLLRDFLDPELARQPPIFRKFRANRSMRDVEHSVELTVKPLQTWG